MVSHAAFIPYRRVSNGYEFFLQKRDANAPGDANIFSTFGGRADDGESEVDTVYREVLEELCYRPVNLQRLGTFQVRNNTFAVFYEEVGADFEEKVTVCEGEYGRFLSGPEIATRSDVSQLRQTVIPPLIERLSEAKST
jgi:8-oxo-dGTP pyrophosphatase MutT (NUDIX family)